jgi:F-type H+-transporting ATPase subunit delta
MVELSTIARPYAEALFGAARADQSAAGVLDQWLAVTEELGAIAGNPDVAAVVSDPSLPADQIYALIAGLMKTKMPIAGENLLKLVIDNGRLAALPEIARQFRQLKNKAEGAADCLIESAFPMSDQQVKDLVWGLSRKMGLQLRPEVKVDPALIGGVRITVGDRVLDSTIRARLAEMRVALMAE